MLGLDLLPNLSLPSVMDDLAKEHGKKDDMEIARLSRNWLRREKAFGYGN